MFKEPGNPLRRRGRVIELYGGVLRTGLPVPLRYLAAVDEIKGREFKPLSPPRRSTWASDGLRLGPAPARVAV